SLWHLLALIEHDGHTFETLALSLCHLGVAANVQQEQSLAAIYFSVLALSRGECQEFSDGFCRGTLANQIPWLSTKRPSVTASPVIGPRSRPAAEKTGHDDNVFEHKKLLPAIDRFCARAT